LDGRNRRIGVPTRLGAAALITLLLGTAVAAGADAQSGALQTTVTVPLRLAAPSVNVRLPAAPEAPLPAVPLDPPAVTPPIEPSALPSPPAQSLAPSVVPEVSGQSPSLPRLPDPSAVARPDTSAPQSPASSGPTSASPAGGPRSSERIASVGASSVKSRKLLRPASQSALRGRPLRELRRVVLRYRDCLSTLSDRGRLALEMRAGLFGRAPAPQRVIAHRIGRSAAGIRRLQRAALRGLISAGEGGDCGGGHAVTAVGAIASGSDARTDISVPAAPNGTRGGGNDDAEPAGAVLGDVHEGGPGIDLDDGEEGATESLLFLVLVLLALFGPLAAIVIARQRRVDKTPVAIAANGNRRPLLFLDVDGVLVLDPRSDTLPPGRIQPSPLGLSYVPDRTGQLVRELAKRFDIVWTTGWEQHANTGLSSMLGLSEDLPTLTFGKKARAGSSNWKIKPVDEYAGDRPIAWLDDNFAARHERWAADRPAPTLLVHVDDRAGLAPGHVERLLDWADRLQRSSGVGEAA
jgi:hypothetical protein